jgi:hypothetical protein
MKRGIDDSGRRRRVGRVEETGKKERQSCGRR